MNVSVNLIYFEIAGYWIILVSNLPPLTDTRQVYWLTQSCQLDEVINPGVGATFS